MAKLILSEGASWVVERLPEAAFQSLKEDLETVIAYEMKLAGYDEEVIKAFQESGPITLERKK